MLATFQPKLPWFLAGGLNPNNVIDALNLLKPDGIDLSSGVERSPGDKDLDKVAELFEKLGNRESGVESRESGIGK
jgi:phosphoribosylanthranilate isomerase